MTWMPMRSASCSLARVKFSAYCCWPAAMAAIAACPAWGETTPSSIAPSMPTAEGTLSRLAASNMRAAWRWVTCEISCARTPASSLSVLVSWMRPVCTPMKPPGTAKAFSTRLCTTKNSKGLACVSAWLASREPSPCRYTSSSGSSRTRPLLRRSRTKARPILYSWSGEMNAPAESPKSGSSSTEWAAPAINARQIGRMLSRRRTGDLRDMKGM